MHFPEQIATSRLLLRWFEECDASDVFARYATDPEVTRFLLWPPHKSVETVAEFLRAGSQTRAEGKRFSYAIRLRDTGLLLGAVGVRLEAPTATLGYLLARDAWGKGYATEAARAVVEAAFDNPEIWRVEATCAPENDASARVLEKLGFTYEGTLRRHTIMPNLDAAPSDVRMYSKVRER